MPSMFPGFRNDPNDLNRQYRPRQRDLTGVPRTITVGYVLLVIVAVLMLVTGLMLVTAQPGENPGITGETAAMIRSNLLWVGVFNLAAAVLIAVLAPQLRRGSRFSRRWLLGVITLSAVADLLSFVILREPFSLSLIAALLMISGVVIFQPSATLFIERKNS